VGAYGGRGEIMDLVAPAGPVYQAGTLSGNPVAMAAGIETLRLLQMPGLYDELDQKGKRLEEGIRTAAAKADIPVQIPRIGSILTVFFTDGPVTDHASAMRANLERFKRFFRALLEEGIYWPPSQFEAAFVSLAHSEEDIEASIGAMVRAFTAIAE